MGHYSSALQWVVSSPTMYKLLIASTLAAVSLAAPEAEADALYTTYGYAGYGYPALHNAYPNWPGVSAPGFSSTVFGLRGKRSADADADAFYGTYGYGVAPYAPVAYGLTGVAAHPTGTSFEARSPQGLSVWRGKRSADADAFYNTYGYGVAPYAAYAPYTYGYGLTGVAGHPTGSSYVARSPQGLRGKRSADAEADADAYYYGGYGYPHAYSGYGYPSAYRGYGYAGLGHGYGRGYYHG